MSEAKDTNPKDAIAGNKAPLDLCPDTLIVAASMAFVEGALKYGKMNFRVCGARASVYKAAFERHMKAWWNGENIDPESNLPHLWKAVACLAILIDCTEAKTLVDDRPPSIDMSALMKRLEPEIARLREAHKGKTPRHYTIADAVKPL